MMRTLFLSLLCMYGALNALQAQGGNYGIAYQAVARDADGDPIAGASIDVRVTLRNAAETVLWTEDHNGVLTSEFGNIALTFGSNTAGLESIDWSASGLHFHIEVNAGGGYQSFGEVNVTAVPVAMYALNGQEDEIAALQGQLDGHIGDYDTFVNSVNNALTSLGNTDTALSGFITDHNGRLLALEATVGGHTTTLNQLLTAISVSGANATVNGNLNVTGTLTTNTWSTSTVQTGTVNAGEANIQELFAVSADLGNTTTLDATVQGTLGVTGNTSVGGNLTVTGNASAAAPTAPGHLTTKAYVDAADANLQSQITAEIANRIADVNAEEDRAEAAEADLQGQITAEVNARIADVNAEEGRAIAAEGALQTAIDNEITARTNDVNAEEARALAAEGALQADIDDNYFRVSNLGTDAGFVPTTVGGVTNVPNHPGYGTANYISAS
ncbi:MAG: hypothetical protein ACO3YQ_07540, partial [Flavobacteriales bacterium]